MRYRSKHLVNDAGILTLYELGVLKSDTRSFDSFNDYKYRHDPAGALA